MKTVDALQWRARLPPAKSWCTLTLRAEPAARMAPFARGRDTRTQKQQTRLGSRAAISRKARRRACYPAFSPLRLLLVLDQKADLTIDAIHRDLIVLDNDLGIFDPKRADAAQGLRGF